MYRKLLSYLLCTTCTLIIQPFTGNGDISLCMQHFGAGDRVCRKCIHMVVLINTQGRIQDLVLGGTKFGKVI